ncbi:hypothetical protein RFI_09687 [Reticulomyxa filosa]|uniref:Uncharacterized protein n=1 Tax=Reticulomyxa filosa TaxID=46433 RepID=X6NMH0_RETFI|nr:hypothetical protein RFI_09687 [Reticulomyxa filosa]|eukprot:ETO27445.1 hypothetical protein RFI_09687 [Reticulomyxa filosa]
MEWISNTNEKNKEKQKKWMQWLKEKEIMDKSDIIGTFETRSYENFKLWLLNESKWKNEIQESDIESICDAILIYTASVLFCFVFFCSLMHLHKYIHICLYILNQNVELKAYVIVNEKKTLIKLRQLTCDELFRRNLACLPEQDLQKIKMQNLKPKLVHIDGSIIESDEIVKKKFQKEPTFQFIWEK